jgi:hypothetical protein
MRLPCSQCQEALFLGSFYEIVYSDDGIHLLCSKECKEKWDFLDRTPNNRLQPQES